VGTGLTATTSLLLRAPGSHLRRSGHGVGWPTLVATVDPFRALATWAHAVVEDGASNTRCVGARRGFCRAGDHARSVAGRCPGRQ
jgi:hypothetical protein